MLKEKLSLSDFDYNLPKELIAQYPAVEREDSRLLVLERGQKRITHGNFKDIVNVGNIFFKWIDQKQI